MFNRKKIAILENRVKALQKRVNDLEEVKKDYIDLIDMQTVYISTLERKLVNNEHFV